jgi:hypothetical protein
MYIDKLSVIDEKYRILPGIDFIRSKLINKNSKNHGYSTLKKMYSIINGEVTECDEGEELSVRLCI